jgi:hypothetical protein
MKEYTIKEFRLLLAKSLRETIEKYEDLLKAGDFHTKDFDAQIGKLGWKLDANPGAGEVHYSHPVVTPKSAQYNKGINQTISRSNNMKRVIPGDKVGYMLKDAGLRLNPRTNEIEVNPNHPYAKLYEEGGYYTPPNAAPKMSTWDSGEQGVEHVPLDKLVSTNDPLPHEPFNIRVQWNSPKGRKVPAIQAMDNGDGTYLVDKGDAALHAAKAHGFTHAPVKLV